MCRTFFSVAVRVIPMIVFAADAKNEMSADLKAMQGHWIRQYAEVDGVVYEKGYKGMEYVMKGSVGSSILKDGRTQEFQIILDPNTNPKRMTLTVDGQTTRSVYKIEDGQMTTIVFNGTDQSWPTEFKPRHLDVVFHDKRVEAKLRRETYRPRAATSFSEVHSKSIGPAMSFAARVPRSYG